MTLGEAVGLFFGVLVILAGHRVNVILGIMAGMIHGLRLNFIEWYHYCFRWRRMAVPTLNALKT